ncbi:MAG: hypothetical protein WC724_02750 [Candidatus Paceibacterota bacterium]|jgi:hypothetical protein
MIKFFVSVVMMVVGVSAFALPPWTGVEGPDGIVGKIPFTVKSNTLLISFDAWSCVIKKTEEGRIAMRCVHPIEGVQDFSGREYLIKRCPDSPAYVKWKSGNSIDPEYFLHLYKEGCG